MTAFRRASLALLAVVPTVITPLVAAKADETLSYGERAKTIILKLVQGRSFAPTQGCEDAAPCNELLARLHAADFSVVAPAELSDRLDMPDYARVRKHCPGLDPLHITFAHRVYAPTHGFAVYRLDLPSTRKSADEILIFRAQHYVPVGGTAEFEEKTPLTPGTFVSIGLRGCRLLSTARAEDGDWLAKHNAIGDSDHASELLTFGGRYVVLNLAPIAAPRQPKANWSYALELWDLGPGADADRRKRRRVYSFTAPAPTEGE